MAGENCRFFKKGWCGGAGEPPRRLKADEKGNALCGARRDEMEDCAALALPPSPSTRKSRMVIQVIPLPGRTIIT